jgi:hypothetical protein
MDLAFKKFNAFRVRLLRPGWRVVTFTFVNVHSDGIITRDVLTWSTILTYCAKMRAEQT